MPLKFGDPESIRKRDNSHGKYGFNGLKKLEAMHAKYGVAETGLKCLDCARLKAYMQSTRWFKCDIYGVSGSVATDWRNKWQACGKFEKREV